MINYSPSGGSDSLYFNYDETKLFQEEQVGYHTYDDGKTYPLYKTVWQLFNNGALRSGISQSSSNFTGNVMPDNIRTVVYYDCFLIYPSDRSSQMHILHTGGGAYYGIISKTKTVQYNAGGPIPYKDFILMFYTKTTDSPIE